MACESLRFLFAVISVYDQAQKRVADRGTLDGEAAKQALWRFDRYERRVFARFCQQTPALGLFGILHGRGLLLAARVHPVSPSVRAETAALSPLSIQFDSVISFFRVTDPRTAFYMQGRDKDQQEVLELPWPDGFAPPRRLHLDRGRAFLTLPENTLAGLVRLQKSIDWARAPPGATPGGFCSA